MEKSVTVRTTKEKVSNSSSPDLYDDILLYILSKLPLKSLKRFECLCKSWSLLFENPYFMAMFRNNFISTYSSDEYLILRLSTSEFPSPLYSLSGEEEGFQKLIRIAMPDTDPENLLSFNILYPNSINGILCFPQRCAESQTVLWNPATKEVKLIPPTPFQAPADVITLYNVLGFGYDRVTNDYKLIHYVYFQKGDFIEDINPPPIWEIYSVRSNSCRKLGNINMSDAAIFTSSSHVYLDGVCHWLFIEKTDSKDYIQDSFQSVTLLASFDLSNEVTFETPLPLEVAEVDPRFRVELGSDFRARRFRRQWALDRWLHLVTLNGSITLIHYHKQTAIFTMSILGELGGKEPWTKLFVVGPLSFVDYPIGVGKELEIFFRTKDGKLARFDFRTQIIGELGLEVENFNRMVIYKESFLPIGGISS